MPFLFKAAQGGRDLSLPPPLKRCASRGRLPLHAQLNMPPRRIQTPTLNPRGSRETYSGDTSIHERAGIRRNAGQASPIRPLFKQGQTQGKNRTTPSLPISSFHYFLHSFAGIRRARSAVLQHRSRPGGPPSPADTSEAARCSSSLA